MYRSSYPPHRLVYLNELATGFLEDDRARSETGAESEELQGQDEEKNSYRCLLLELGKNLFSLYPSWFLGVFAFEDPVKASPNSISFFALWIHVNFHEKEERSVVLLIGPGVPFPRFKLGECFQSYSRLECSGTGCKHNISKSIRHWGYDRIVVTMQYHDVETGQE